MSPASGRIEKPRRWLRAAAWIALAVTALYLFFQFSYSIRVIPEDDAEIVSEIELVDLEGRAVDLTDYRGRVVLLNLWASWCGPCRAEIPGLARLDERLRSRGLVVLGLNVDEESPERVVEVAARLGVTYGVVLPLGELTGSFAGAGVLPHSWLIDRRGRLRASHAGLATERSFRKACEKLLAER